MECHCLARSFTSFGKPQSILTYPLIFNPQERIKFSWTCWEDYQENKARGPAPQMKKSEHSQSRYTGSSSKETSNIHTYCSVLFLIMHSKKPAAHSHRTVVSFTVSSWCKVFHPSKKQHLLECLYFHTTKCACHLESIFCKPLHSLQPWSVLPLTLISIM